MRPKDIPQALTHTHSYLGVVSQGRRAAQLKQSRPVEPRGGPPTAHLVTENGSHVRQEARREKHLLMRLRPPLAMNVYIKLAVSRP